MRVLESNGITPDFVVCLDAANVDKTLTGLEDFCVKINCIMDLKSDLNLLNRNFRRTFVSFSENDFVVKKLAEYNKFIKTYESGGSAATMALVAAQKLGFDRIIFTGLDLAIKDGVLYSTGESVNKVSDSQIAIDNTTKNIVYVKSVTGDKVATRDDYAAFIKHFEMFIKDLDIKEIYNTSSFGANIEGMKNITFDEIPLSFTLNATSIILGEARPFKFEINEWAQQELFLINNVINLLSKGVFSPALISAIVKSSLLYQYMQSDILKVLQSKFNSDNADEFIEKTKTSIKVVVELLQKNRLI